jgi:hypothetical protein
MDNSGRAGLNAHPVADPLTAYDLQFINALAQVQWHSSNPFAIVRLGHDQCNCMYAVETTSAG